MTDNNKKNIAKMFNNISKTYDSLNHILSFGIDIIWRKKVTKIVNSKRHNLILDVATGTGDLAIAMSKTSPKEIVAIDISEKMLNIANKKIKARNLEKLINIKSADCEKLPFEENKFDITTCSFGVRNFSDLNKGLSEIYRTLKPKGVAIILEFSTPTNKFIYPIYNLYFKKIVPTLGKWLSKNKKAYTYLYNSAKEFPFGEKFKNILSDIGFKNVMIKRLTFGVASIYIACK